MRDRVTWCAGVLAVDAKAPAMEVLVLIEGQYHVRANVAAGETVTSAYASRLDIRVVDALRRQSPIVSISGTLWSRRTRNAAPENCRYRRDGSATKRSDGRVEPRTDA